MYEENEIAGVIIHQATGDDAEGIIVQGADDGDEVAGIIVQDATGGLG
jgi:hypothetical protein